MGIGVVVAWPAAVDIVAEDVVIIGFLEDAVAVAVAGEQDLVDAPVLDAQEVFEACLEVRHSTGRAHVLGSSYADRIDAQDLLVGRAQLLPAAGHGPRDVVIDGPFARVLGMATVIVERHLAHTDQHFSLGILAVIITVKKLHAAPLAGGRLKAFDGVDPLTRLTLAIDVAEIDTPAQHITHRDHTAPLVVEVGDLIPVGKDDALEACLELDPHELVIHVGQHLAAAPPVGQAGGVAHVAVVLALEEGRVLVDRAVAQADLAALAAPLELQGGKREGG